MKPGEMLGPYRVVSELGAGGMGQVYRARDTSLNRDVALKVLPAGMASDADRLARFQREAEALAALNHSNIAAIYGIERGGEAPALVMELVEGHTLDEIIVGSGPSPSAQGREPAGSRGLAMDDALAIASQIASALESAHESGIIHRDLKPANIKIRDDGTVKVLDFGLAKAFDPGGESREPGAESPTMTSPAVTQHGVILGTAAYMAPEQAKGRVVDKRADVWAFGVVLYEMLTGRGLFHGDTLVETLAQVMTHEPQLDALPAAVPPAVRQLLARCLERDPKQRLRDIGEARILLTSPAALAPPAESPAAHEASTPRSTWRPTYLVAIAGALALGLVAGAAWFRPAPSTPGEVTRFAVDLAPDTHLGPAGDYSRPYVPSFALSPDGRHLVYAGENDTGEGRQLYLRHMDQGESMPLPGTEGGYMPVFSPGSDEIVFLQRTDQGGLQLMRMPIAGGPARSLPDLPILPVSWSDDDEILFAGGRGIFAVSSGGGEPRQLTTPEEGSTHRHPQMLPGGKAVLYNVARGAVPSRWDVVVEDLESHERQVVVTGGSYPKYSASGHLLFVRNGKLMALAFDPTTLAPRGDPRVVLEDVMQTESGGNGQNRSGFSQYVVSQTGTLAYVEGGVIPIPTNMIGWMTRDGTFTELPVSPAKIWYPTLSPDDTRLAWLNGVDDRNLWVFDLDAGSPRRLTEGLGYRSTPIWSPDGTQLTYLVDDGGESWLELLSVDRSDPPRRIDLGANLLPTSWSSANVLALLEGPLHHRIWTMPMDGSNTPALFIESASADMDYPTFSPDGNWLAYTSDEAGRGDVHVLPYPREGRAPVIASPNGGSAPAWSRDGQELFYRQGSQLVSVGVTTQDGFRRNGAPRVLFDYSNTAGPQRNYDVALDGRFVMPGPSESIPPQPVTRINLVLNWFEELRRLAPGR